MTLGVAIAPRMAGVGSLSARPVITAYLKTAPMVPRRRRAVSKQSLASKSCSSRSTSTGRMSLHRLSPRSGSAKPISHSFFVMVTPAKFSRRRFSRYSAATSRKVSPSPISGAEKGTFDGRRVAGSIPSRSDLRACSRRSRASESGTSGYPDVLGPKEGEFAGKGFCRSGYGVYPEARF